MNALALSHRRPPATRVHRSYGAFQVALAIGVALAAFFTVWMGFELGGSVATDHFDDIAELIAALIAGVSCFVASFRDDTVMRHSWRFLAGAGIAWALGEAVWCWYDIIRNAAVPFPSLADVGFLLAGVLMLAAVFSFPSVQLRAVSLARTLMDGLLVAGSLLFISWTTTLGTTFHMAHGHLLSRVVAVTYPVADVAIATVALSILVLAGVKRRSTLGFIASGMIAMAVADSAFAYFTQVNNYPSDAMLDIGWVVGFLLIALAPFWPKSAPVADHTAVKTSTSHIVLPLVLLAGAAGAGIDVLVTNGHLDTFSIVDGLALIAVVLIRQALTLSENVGLTRRLEHAIATLRAEEAELSRQAMHDPLTGVGNRVLFTTRLGDALARGSRERDSLAVLFCDLDSFKDVNDTLGHSAGDALLVAVAERIREGVRQEDTVARLGGDEFAIVLDGLVSRAEAASIAARIIETMRAPLTIANKRLNPLMSIGVALPSSPETSVEDLLRDADVALYVAKARGGDGFRFYDPELGDAHLDRLELQSEFSRAIAEDEFFLEYQPIVAIATGRPVGVETLLRWRHPRRGVLLPDAFLAHAEQSGAIVAIGKWVLGKALHQMHEWHQNLPVAANMTIAVNLSVRQLGAEDLLEVTKEAIRKSGIDPQLVRLELTETALIDRSEETIEVLRAIRSLGVELEIDDFGTGYSSLGYLKRLPVDALKIDQSFVSGLGSDARDSHIVRAVVHLAQALGIAVTAEGIETTEQLNELRALQCEHGQGFYWSPSLSPEEYERWLEATMQTLDGVATSH